MAGYYRYYEKYTKKKTETWKFQQGPVKRDGLNEYYLNAVKGMPRLRDSLSQVIQAVEVDGTTAFQSLDREIMIQMTILREAFEEMAREDARGEHPNRGRIMKSMRTEIGEHIETLRKLKETNNEFYHGTKYNIRLDEAVIFVQTVMQILLSEIKDAKLLHRIVDKIDALCGSSFQGDVTSKVKEIEVVRHERQSEEGSGVDMADDPEMAMADDSGRPDSGGIDRDADIPMDTEGASAEDQGDRPATK